MAPLYRASKCRWNFDAYDELIEWVGRCMSAVGQPRSFGDVGFDVRFARKRIRPGRFMSTRPKEKPRLPEWTGLELESVRPLQSPVSPSAATRNVDIWFHALPGLRVGIVSER